jgi:hypothetical protein
MKLGRASQANHAETKPASNIHTNHRGCAIAHSAYNIVTWFVGYQKTGRENNMGTFIESNKLSHTGIPTVFSQVTYIFSD